MHRLHLTNILLTIASIIPASTAFNCPPFWESYDDEFCYMVLNSKWPASHDGALDFCRGFSDHTNTATLLEILPFMDIDRLNISTPTGNYWIGPVKFLDKFYNLIHDSGPIDMDSGEGGCSILSISKDGTMLIPTSCGIGNRPFICALYPKQPERNLLKRSQLNCKNLENTANNCEDRSIGACQSNSKGCEKRCCEMMAAAESAQTCSDKEDAWGGKTCSFVKESGNCGKHAEKCALTCCESSRGNQHKPCSKFVNTKGARYCYDKAFFKQQCEVPENECALACCVAHQMEEKISRKRRLVTFTIPTFSSTSPTSSTSGFTDFTSSFTTSSFTTSSHTSFTTSSDTSTTSYDSLCYDLGLDNKNGDDFCRDRLLDDPDKCENDNFRGKCELACCVIDPSPCLEYTDKLSEAICYQRVLLGRCSETGTAKKCKRSCCEAGELETTTQSTTSEVTTKTETDATSVTTESTTYQLCGEYTDIGANCERRVEKGRCNEPLSEEVKCPYSCCLDLFKSTTPDATTVQTTTETTTTEGIMECLDYEDEASPEFCAAVMSENQCDVWESQHLCEFSCCMYNYAHDTEDAEAPEVEINEDCDDHVDTLPYEECLEAFVLGKCEETSECAKTCCLWDGTFFGNPCLRFLDESGYEHCTINCFDQCDDDNLCEVLCPRTVCLFCNKPDVWPSSTSEPSECLGLTNEDSGVDCAVKAAQGECVSGDGFYDEQCDFSCCVVEIHQKRSGRQSLVFYDNAKRMQLLSKNVTKILESEKSIESDLLVRKKRSEIFVDREMQIQPSYIFIGSVLILAKLCL